MLIRLARVSVTKGSAKKKKEKRGKDGVVCARARGERLVIPVDRLS